MKFVTAIAWIATISSSSTICSTEAFAGLSSLKKFGGYRSSQLYYESEGGSSNGNRKPNTDTDPNVWSVLSHTEQWISETLQSSETESGTNPYSRKEVNYVCEMNEDSPMIAANMFKRLREARELGQRHGEVEADHMVEQGPSYRPHTMRQTQVMVIPSNKALCESFHVFDNFINAVNTARRNARDYVTDKNLEKLNQELTGEEPKDWSVSVNCAHLHPDFGKKTPEETLKEMQQEEEAGEVDLNMQEYAKKRLLARQSPYPTIVVEVRATPPPDWGESPPPSIQKAEIPVDEDADEEEEESFADYQYNRKELLQRDVTADDVRQLEALFGKAAVTDKNVQDPAKEEFKEKEEDFYDKIGQSMGIEEIAPVSPMRIAQGWITENDEKFSPVTSAFTETDILEIDHGYEFVFTNLAMQKEQARTDNIHGARRQYLVMPHFLSSSATSLEKFTKEVMNIVNTLPDLREKVKISTFHPEHVQQGRRSPMPIVCLQWTEGGTP